MFEINHRVKFGLFRLKDVYYAPAINFNEKHYDVVYYISESMNYLVKPKPGNVYLFDVIPSNHTGKGLH